MRALLLILSGALILLAYSLATRPVGKEREKIAPVADPRIVSELVGTRVETAAAKLKQGRPDEALAMLVAALKADHTAAGARELSEDILRQTVWNIPVIKVSHPMPVDRIEYAAPGTLWASMGGKVNTTVRWNLDNLRIESVLFPLPDARTRSLVRDAAGRRLVVERAGILLLCDARTLKPVKDLGALPDFVTPPSVIVFSDDGLLMAHPAVVPGNGPAISWHLRDAATGEILRTSEPAKDDAIRPLAAFLDRNELRVLHADGGMLEMPVSPVREARITAATKPVKLLHAQFNTDGASALVLVDQGPHEVPKLSSWRDGGMIGETPDWSGMLERFPWNRHPGIWTGLLRECPQTPLTVEGNSLFPRDGMYYAPIHAASAITAVAAGGVLRLVGEDDGALTVYQLLPRPRIIASASRAWKADEQTITALEDLTEFLAGFRQDEASLPHGRMDDAERLRVFGKLDFPALGRLFPKLDFGPIIEVMRGVSLKESSPDATCALTERLARADPASPDAASSPAARFALVLEGTFPEAIRGYLASVTDMPPLLRKLALSRIAWLEDRKADALAGWPDVFPDISELRKREDWDGWEQADFSQALEKLQLCILEEIAALQMPENPTTEQKKKIIKRLMDADTLRAVGPSRLAQASLAAATVLASDKEEAEAALQLAGRALNLGEAAESCMRAEARAYSTLGDYQKSRDRWVLLLTEHPVATHQPGDYSEAAYTAFESADPNQAIEILTTGLHRFPGDAEFALRAGWIALLAGSPDRAGRFILAGREAGLAPEKLEYATALLAIAATQNGSVDDAAVYRNELLRLNPAWGEKATIDVLDWPEEFKAALLPPEW
jgi:tetratricopeptide (TPR) repeat protein